MKKWTKPLLHLISSTELSALVISYARSFKCETAFFK